MIVKNHNNTNRQRRNTSAVFSYFILTSLESADESESQRVSMSLFSVYSERLTRSEQSASAGVMPKAMSAPLGFLECEEQAEPLETKTPSAERK